MKPIARNSLLFTTQTFSYFFLKFFPTLIVWQKNTKIPFLGTIP